MYDPTAVTPRSAETDDEYLANQRGKHRFGRSMGAWAHGEELGRNDALRALEAIGPVLYAVRLPSGIIKIGFTSRINQRLQELRTEADALGFGREVELLAFRFGSRHDEREAHATLEAHRCHGIEWYHPHAEVLALVNSWRSLIGREPIAA